MDTQEKVNVTEENLNPPEEKQPAEIFPAEKKLDKRQLDITRVLYHAFKEFRMFGGDISKNEKLWNSKAVHKLKKLGIKESEYVIYLPIADYVRKLVLNPIKPENLKA